MPFSFRALASGGVGCKWDATTGDCTINLPDSYRTTVQNSFYDWQNCTLLFDTGYGCSPGAPGYCHAADFGASTFCVPDNSFPSGTTTDAYTEMQKYFDTCFSVPDGQDFPTPCVNYFDTWLLNIGCNCQAELNIVSQQIGLCVSAPNPTACAAVTNLSASDSKGLSGGAIAGIVVGVLAGIALLVAVAVAALCCLRRKRVPPAAVPGKLGKLGAGEYALAQHDNGKLDGAQQGVADAPGQPAASWPPAEIPPERLFHAQHTGNNRQAVPAYDGRGEAAVQLAQLPPAARQGPEDQFFMPPPPSVPQPGWDGQQQYAAQHDPRLVYQPAPPHQMAYAAQAAPPSPPEVPMGQYSQAAYQNAPQQVYVAPVPSQAYQQPPASAAAYYPPAAAAAASPVAAAGYAQAPRAYDDDEPLPEPPAWSGKPGGGAVIEASEPRSEGTFSSVTTSLVALSRTSASDLPDGIAIPKGLALYTNPFDNSSEVEEKRQALERAKAQVTDVNVVLDYLTYECNGDVDGKYILDEGASRVRGGQATIAFAKGRYGGVWAIKFFNDHATFVQEESVYKLLLDEDPAAVDFVRDARSHEGDTVGNGLTMPSYIVLKKGMSMADWIRTRKPPPLMALWMLGEVCTQVAVLHSNGLVHRDLKPGNLLWLPDENAFRLIDFGCTVRENEEAKPAYTLHFAAPELVTAIVQGHQTTVVHPSSDVWAVGVMAFEIVSGEPLFPPGAATVEIKDILVGTRPFPHEERPEVWTKMGRLRKVVQAMLDRDPSKRPTIAEIQRRLDNMAMATGATTATYRKRLATNVAGGTFSTSGSTLPK